MALQETRKWNSRTEATNRNNMDAIIEEVVSTEDLKKFEKAYNEQVNRGPVSPKTQFEYAWCLVRSQYGSDLRRGISLLEDLFHKTTDDGAKRDYLYYLAVGNIRVKEYDKALKFTNGILAVEPRNHQANQLREYIEKKMKRDGLIGMAVVGGAAALVMGGIVSLGVALSKK